MGGFDDSLDAHLLTEAYCHRVDTLGEGTLQRDGVSREGTIGIGWSPFHHLVLLLVIHIHGDIFVTTLVAWSQTLIHRLGIDEELEG